MGYQKMAVLIKCFFFPWLIEVFIKNIPPTRPVLLLLDGHSTHYTPEVTRAAAEQGVVMLCLPPHTTHAIQPLDVSFFKSLRLTGQQFVTNTWWITLVVW